MKRFQNILVGVDLSSGDRFAFDDLSLSTVEAIHQGIRAASLLDAKLTFFASLDLSAQTEELMAQDTLHLTNSVDDDAVKVLKRIHELAKSRDLESDIVFAHGHAWETIIKKVIKDNHDLVIVGTRAHSLMDRIAFGTTGVKLLRYCPCPVWVTKPGGIDKEVIDVLVADDLEKVGEACLSLAIQGGQQIPTRTHVVHVVEDEKRGWFSSKPSAEELEATRQKRKEEAEIALEQRLTSLDYRTLERGVQVHVECGEPADIIGRMIDEFEIDLLIMGTAKRSGLSGILFGSTTERILSRVNCSLLAVKPEGYESPIRAD